MTGYTIEHDGVSEAIIASGATDPEEVRSLIAVECQKRVRAFLHAPSLGSQALQADGGFPEEPSISDIIIDPTPGPAMMASQRSMAQVIEAGRNSRVKL